MKITNLRCEYLLNPMGIDVKNPIITWNLIEGKSQTAFEIIAYENGEVIYRSNKVLTNEMRFTFPLPPKSRSRIDYDLYVYDENGEKSEKASSYFEYTLLNEEDFKAKWIKGNYSVSKKKRYPVDYFKKEFNSKKVKKARLYLTSLGIYEAKINGERVGSFILAPGHTDYNKRIQLQTYDVTSLIKEGKNEIVCLLSDGYYRGSLGAWGRTYQYGKETKLYFQLEIEYEDGSKNTIISDKSWRWSNDGKYLFADLQDGEIIDARKSPSYSNFAKESKCKIIPSASNNVYVEEHETFKPKIIKTPKGKTILDFGQNIAGYLKFNIVGKSGDTIYLRFGEMFDKEGEFTQKNIQCSTKKKTTPLQEVKYTFKDGLNSYKTKFAIFGFQYVLVDTTLDIKEEDFEAIAVYSSLESTLKFNSSNNLLNQFVDATRWSAKNNHADVPTDCPTRERHGWTGDAQIFVKSASYLFMYPSFARKYINDMKDGQKRNGCYLQITPKGGIDFYMNSMDGSAGWSDAGIFIPYRIYTMYHDKKILEKNYSSMKRFAKFKIKTLGKWYLTSLPTGVGFKNRKNISNYGQSYGEWAEPTDVNAFQIKDFICPHPEETTAYLYYMLVVMSEIAKILDHDEDSKYYKEVSLRVKKGYQALVETKKFSLDTNRQAKLIRPLYMGLLNEKQEEYAKNRLVKAIKDYDYRLGTGFLSTPFILYVLEKIDLDLTFKILENEKMPGWLFMSKMGAKTIWESWEGTAAQGGIASLNHYSKGALVEWVVSRLAGINVDGINTFKISPLVGGNFKFVEASYLSIYGEVSSKWKKEDGKIIYEISVPTNCKAKIILQNNEEIVVEAGKHTFSVDE